MSQVSLFPTLRGTGPLIVAYGGGVNTIALLLELFRRGERPDGIVMSDPGDEWPETHVYRDTIMNPWLAERGWPTVTVVSVISEAPFRPRASKTEQTTLMGECNRIKSVPSIAYGKKKCSQKYKARPANWWMERMPFVREAWARGEKVTRAIGYDADEPGRAHPQIADALEARRFTPYYPLLDAGINREDCEAIILAAGLPLPHKSACRRCPANKLHEWAEFRERFPEDFAEAMAMERDADIDNREVVGLMRCMPAGKRQLHLHVWQGPVPPPDDDDRDAMPCECAL